MALEVEGLKWDRDYNLVDTLTPGSPIAYLVRQNHKTGKWYGIRAGKYIDYKPALPRAQTQEYDTLDEAKAVVESIANADHEFIQEEFPWHRFTTNFFGRRGTRAWDLTAGEIKKTQGYSSSDRQDTGEPDPDLP